MQFNMSGYANRAKAGQVGIRFVKICRAVSWAGAPRKAPCTVEGLLQRGYAVVCFFHAAVADMVGMRVQPVHFKNGRVGQPVKFGLHNCSPLLDTLFYNSSVTMNTKERNDRLFSGIVIYESLQLAK